MDNRSTELLRQYSHALLPWQIGPEAPPASTPSPCPSHQDILNKMLRACTRTPRKHILLLGLADGVLAAGLAAALPDQYTLTVLERRPHTLRAATPHAAHSPKPTAWWLHGRHTVLCDDSIQAMLLLLHATGRIQQPPTMLLHPGLSPQDRPFYKQLQRLLLSITQLDPDASIPANTLHNTSSTVSVPALASAPCHAHDQSLRIPPTVGPECACDTSTAPGRLSLSICAILHPDEPRLEEFFAHLPPQAAEAVIIWDAPHISMSLPHAPCPVRHYVRPLDGDFARQRNMALDHARSRWVFFLDGDERLAPDQWQSFAALIRIAEQHTLGGIMFPRMTYWPCAASVLGGFGLWPDMQLRLLRACQSLRFVKPVHESATGLCGPLGIAPALPIKHFSRLFKDEAALAAKLRVFDAAAGRAHHRLNTAYPTLPEIFFHDIIKRYHAHIVLMPDMMPGNISLVP